jgi:hypothetical protein
MLHVLLSTVVSYSNLQFTKVLSKSSSQDFDYGACC